VIGGDGGGGEHESSSSSERIIIGVDGSMVNIPLYMHKKWYMNVSILAMHRVVKENVKRDCEDA